MTDSSALYNVEEAKNMGIEAVPLCINLGEWEGYDLQMDMERFYAGIKSGLVPKSSQPSIGEVLEAYEAYPDQPILNITIADGLSGTYQSACSAKEMATNSENITVFNTRTLCGPHRYMVDRIIQMAKDGKGVTEILSWLEKAADSAESFLIPQDFSFLRRGGRLTPLAATIGGLLKLKPVLHATEDGKRLDKFCVKRTLSSSVKDIIVYLKKKQIGAEHILYVSHANALKDMRDVKQMLVESFPKVEIRTLELSPAFVTQGGPGCIAIQFIKKIQ